MSPKHQRDPKKERFWRGLLRQWHKSRLSIRDFCRQHDLPESRFYFWRRTLAERDAEGVRFLPVQVVPDDPSPAVTETVAGLELLLDGGRVLRVGPAFDGPTLRRLLAVLEERPS